MDTFWLSLRIGCFSIIAIIGLGIGSCTFLSWRDEQAKARMADSLRERSVEILQQKNTAVTALKTLFGDDMDGICIVFASGFSEEKMRAASAAEYAMAISTIAQIPKETSLDSDILHWGVYIVKGAAVLRKYDLIFRSTFDMHGEANRCYEPGTLLELKRFPREGDGRESIFMTISGPKNSAGQ